MQLVGVVLVVGTAVLPHVVHPWHLCITKAPPSKRFLLLCVAYLQHQATQRASISSWRSSDGVL